MTSTEPSYSAQRHATRAPVDLVVRLQVEGSEAVFDGRCNNVSIGGMFVITELLCGAGDQMRFELEIEGEGVIQGLAEVVWRQPGDLRRQPGVGFKFRYLEQRDRQLIFKLVSRHIKDRLASRQPMATPVVPQGEPPAVVQPPASAPTPSADQRPEVSVGPPAFEVAPPAFEVAPPAPAESETIAPDPEQGSPEQKSFSLGLSVDDPLAAGASPPAEATANPQQSLDFLPQGAQGDPEVADFAATDPASQAPESSGGEAASFDGMAASNAFGFDAGPASGELEASPDPAPASPPPEPFGFEDLAFDATPDLPLGSPSAAPAPAEPSGGPSTLEESADEIGHEYSDYLGSDHFDHRPAPRRDWPPWALAGLLLLLAGAMAYLFGGRFFDLSSGTETKPPATAEAAAPGESGEQTSVEEPQASGETPSAEAAPAEARRQPPSSRPAASPGSSPAARTPPRQQSPPPGRARAGQGLAKLEKLSFRRNGQAAEIVITTDVAVGSHDHFRLDGDKPRIVVRLFGMKRFDGQELAIGHGGVRRARAGWHRRERRGPQVHVVLDLDDSRSKVLETRTEGRNLVVRVGR